MLMDNSITFKKIEFDKPIISILSSREVRVLHGTTYDVLRNVEAAGGFIAGGFAAKFAYCHLMLGDLRTSDRSAETLMRYSNIDHLRAATWSKDRKFAKVNAGDIDVFFENDKYVDTIVHQAILKKDDYHVEPTTAGFGWEVGCFGRNGCNLIQLITKYTGTPEQVCSTFDIYNAACVIKGNVLYVPEEWEWLAKNRYLHLRKWNGPWVMQRLAKWSRKHHYGAGLTPETALLLNNHITEILDDPENSKTPDTVYRFITKKIHPFMQSINPEHLLKISMCYPDQSYNYAFEELKRRSAATLSRVVVPEKSTINDVNNIFDLL